MNSKEQKIKEAYKHLFTEGSDEEKELRFNEIKNFIDDYGWLSGNIHNVEKDLIEISGHEIRPKSLQGIEDNNGWIKIESEDDLPKELSDVFFFEHGNVTHGFFDGKRFICNYGVFGYKTITHYKPIEKPKPPLY